MPRIKGWKKVEDKQYIERWRNRISGEEIYLVFKRDPGGGIIFENPTRIRHGGAWAVMPPKGNIKYYERKVDAKAYAIAWMEMHPKG